MPQKGIQDHIAFLRKPPHHLIRNLWNKIAVISIVVSTRSVALIN